MKKEKLLEALLHISYDQWGRPDTSNPPLIEFDTALQFCAEHGMTKEDAFEYLKKMHMAGYIDANFDSKDAQVPSALRVSELGESFYKDYLSRILTDF